MLPLAVDIKHFVPYCRICQIEQKIQISVRYVFQKKLTLLLNLTENLAASGKSVYYASLRTL